MSTKVKGTEGVEFPDGTTQTSAGNVVMTTPSGSCRFGNGIIFQWIEALVPAGQTLTFPLPFSFPNTALFALATAGTSNAPSSVPWGTVVPDLGSVTVTNGGSIESAAYVLVIGN